ncbi:MAG: cytochrome c family protein [Nitrospirae bacterium]|nr:cytochrome c family protein [Nitrospirota bacterium]
MKSGRLVYSLALVLVVTAGALGGIHAHANENTYFHRYVGDETCEVCHSSARIGNQFQIWKSSPHARAYRDLGSPEALSIARKMGISNPKNDMRCLSCHTTAAGTHLPQVISTFRKRDGVQCESCHGPGEDYAHFSTMIDPVKSRKAGLAAHPEKSCVTCHNPSSPTFRGFDARKSLAEIAHPVPEKYKKAMRDAYDGDGAK